MSSGSWTTWNPWPVSPTSAPPPPSPSPDASSPTAPPRTRARASVLPDPIAPQKRQHEGGHEQTDYQPPAGPGPGLVLQLGQELRRVQQLLFELATVREQTIEDLLIRRSQDRRRHPGKDQLHQPEVELPPRPPGLGGAGPARCN